MKKIDLKLRVEPPTRLELAIFRFAIYCFTNLATAAYKNGGNKGTRTLKRLLQRLAP